MIINVGSKNRVKRAAVEEVCAELFGKITARCFAVGSGVSHTPLSDDEVLKGAATRARRAYRQGGADLGIGLEGGIVDSLHGPVLKGWVVVYDGEQLHAGCTPGAPFPGRLLDAVGEGKELAQVMEAACGEKDIRSKQGAFGYLTRNRITRKETFKLALYCALAPVYNNNAYCISM